MATTLHIFKRGTRYKKTRFNVRYNNAKKAEEKQEEPT